MSFFLSSWLGPVGAFGVLQVATEAASLASDQEFRHFTKGRKGTKVSIEGFRGEGFEKQPTAQATQPTPQPTSQPQPFTTTTTTTSAPWALACKPG